MQRFCFWKLLTCVHIAPYFKRMLTPRLVLSSLLLGAPLLSQAQNAEPAPYPRYYVGLAAYSSYYQALGGGNYRPTRLPLQLTAGYHWRPRLAVQVGLAYSGTSRSYFSIGRTYPSPGYAIPGVQGSYYDYTGRVTGRNASVALLARYTLTRQPAHRVQFDVLGGFTWEHSSYRDYGSRADSVQNSLVLSAYEERSNTNRLLLTLGPSVRYCFGPHLTLFYDLLFNTSVVSNQDYQIKGITSSSALGLRYRFGH
jgi:hypothetical protein